MGARIFGCDTVHGCGTFGNLNAGVSQPLASSLHAPIRVQQKQRSGHDAGGRHIDTGGL